MWNNPDSGSTPGPSPSHKGGEAMEARFTPEDGWTDEGTPLPFTESDVDRIHIWMLRRYEIFRPCDLNFFGHWGLPELKL